MTTRLRILVGVLCSALFMSCHRQDVPALAVLPEGYAEVLEMYKNGQKYTEAYVDGEMLRLSARENEIAMSLAGMVVDEGFVGNPQVVSIGDDGCWYVGGKPTGVRRNPELSDEEAVPFYLFFTTDKSLHIRVNNGLHIVIGKQIRSIPCVYLTTSDGGEITSKEEYKEGTIVIEDPDGLYWNTPKFEVSMKIRGRGNSTWGMPKKPYKIKLDKKARLFDMSTDKEWCLLANYTDKSLIRNIVAMEISRRLGFSWTPRMLPVEVYLNESYQGVYCFSEHKKVSSERVNIDVDAGDILFELEQSLDEPVCWTTEHGAPVMFSDPDEPSQEQISYAKSFFKGFEDALWAKDFSSVYEKYIDVPSFINNFIIQELTKNVDGNLRKSTFLTLPMGGKLEMYHVWDFDLILGNCDYYNDGLPTWQGWWIKDQGAWGRGHGWYYRLFMDPDFTAQVKRRWIEMYPQLETIPEYIAKQVDLLGDAPDHNFARWQILDRYIWPNGKVTGSYEGEVDWLLENYSKRLKWLDTQIRSW